MADTQDKKTDVLNLRLDAALAAEIQRIAEWRGTSASEIARDLMRHGVNVERQLEAQELHRSYESPRIKRDPDRGYLKVDARWVWYTSEELADRANDDWWVVPLIERHLTTRELAELLAVHPETIRRAAAGALRSIRVGRDRRYPESAVKAWIAGLGRSDAA